MGSASNKLNKSITINQRHLIKIKLIISTSNSSGSASGRITVTGAESGTIYANTTKTALFDLNFPNEDIICTGTGSVSCTGHESWAKVSTSVMYTQVSFS